MAMVPEDVADMLVVEGLAIKAGAGANMWGNYMANAPDKAVGLYQSSGFEPVDTMGGLKDEPTNLQVITRDKNASVSYEFMMAIFRFLHRHKETRNGYHYTIMARHMPHTLGEDENRRHKWSCNFKVDREPV